MKYFFKRTPSLYFLNVPKEELGRKFLPVSYADKNVCITFFLILSEATSPTAKRKKKTRKKEQKQNKTRVSRGKFCRLLELTLFPAYFLVCTG